MARTGVIRLANFTGGEASIFPETAMPPKYSMLMSNCYVSERGNIVKVPGYEKVNQTDVGVTLTSGFEFRKADGTIEILVAGGGNIYKVGLNNELSVIHSGLDAAAKVSFAQMNDICIICNGVNAPLKYDGTTVSTLGGSPPATAFKAHVHKGRVWMIERTNKMLATHSALNNPEDYTTSNDAGYIDFKYVLKEGDELLDIATYIDLLVFFFRNHIVIYSGTNPTANGDFRMVQLFRGIGVVQTDTVQALGNDMVFLYDSGVKTLRQVVTTGNLNTEDVSERIDPSLRAAIGGLSETSSAHYPKKGWYLLQIDSTVYVYNYSFKAWSRIVGADIHGMFSTADGELYLCGTGYLYRYGTGYSFAGQQINMKWQTAWFDIGRGLKAYPSMMIMRVVPDSGASQQLKISIAYDKNLPFSDGMQTVDISPSEVVYIDQVTDWDALTHIDEIMFNEVRVPLFGGGSIMQLTFEEGSTAGVEINDLIIQLTKGGI